MLWVDLMKSVCFFKICSSSPKPWLTSSRSKGVPLQYLLTTKLLISSSRRIGQNYFVATIGKTLQ